MTDRLKGKRALVTAAGQGIGRASALMMAREGAHVIATDVNEAALAELKAEGLETMRLDVRDPASIAAAVAAAGDINVLFNCAGFVAGGTILECDEDQWAFSMDLNMTAMYRMCRAFLPVMLANGGGSIVIVSSTAGQRGEAGYSNYAASKGGQIAFTKALSNELAPAIRVNAVAPGWVDTNLNDPVFIDDEFRKRVIDGIPLNRVATADDVALSIVFLASDWSRHITGEVLNVNGGAVLCG